MKDYYNFAYKPMDETMGPYCYDCPVSILKLLSDTDNDYALAWRQKCWDNHNQKKNPNSIQKLPETSIIKVIMPFDTTYFKEGDIVKLRKDKSYYSNRTRWYVVQRAIRFTSGLMKQLEGHYEVIK